MKRVVYNSIFLCIIMITGSLFWLYRQGWLMITYPQAHLVTMVPITRHKKTVPLHIWHHDAWHTELVSCIWSDTNAHNAEMLVKKWLTLLEDEQIIKIPIRLQSAIITPSGSTLYLSFDRPLTDSQKSTYANWHVIESLFKTLRGMKSSVQELYLLVDHKSMLDNQLDFSGPWPLEGFVGTADS